MNTAENFALSEGRAPLDAGWRAAELAICDASFRRDDAELQAIVGRLADDSTCGGRYYFGLATFYWLSSPEASARQSGAGALVRNALSAVDSICATDGRLASEQFALRGSLGSLLVAASRGLDRAKAGFQSVAALNQAVKADPTNPRAEFAAAAATLAMSRPRGRDQEEAVERLARCDALFAAPGEREALPGWGRSHLWLYLAKYHARRDESVLAQRWLERFQREHTGRAYMEADALRRKLAGG